MPAIDLYSSFAILHIVLLHLEMAVHLEGQQWCTSVQHAVKGSVHLTTSSALPVHTSRKISAVVL